MDQVLRFFGILLFGTVFLFTSGTWCRAEAVSSETVSAETLFQIGSPDYSSAEFAHHVRFEDFFGKPDEPVVNYVVGRDRPRNWTPALCSTRDFHNAGHAFSARIEFESPKTVDVPLYLITAMCYGHPTEPSLLQLTVNGTQLEPMRVVPGQEGFPPFDPQVHDGWPSHIALPIPAGLVKAGQNEIRMKIFDGSWIHFDYLALRTQPEPLALERRSEMLAKARAAGGPMEDVKELLFAVRQPSFDGHWYANFGYYACDTNAFPFPLGGGGALRILDLETGEVRTLFEDPQGNIRDPQVHYDARKCIFSYLKAGTRHYHLYEINLDGTGLRQLTDGNWDDIEPTYLPNGDIVFPSSRAKRWVQCWLTGVANLHRCGPNGEDVRPISSNPEQENTPWVLPNGQLLYMRWEYIDRSQVHYHHLWTANPDGTRHQIFYGNQTPGICMLGAKPIRYRKDVPPEERKFEVCATVSPGHGMREHYGAIALVDPRKGPDAPEGAKQVSVSQWEFADPWAFSEDCILCVSRSRIVLMDGEGRLCPVYTLPQEEADRKFYVADVQPIIVREREQLIADVTDRTQKTGTLAMANIYEGRQMKDLAPGTVKELLVMEPLPIPVHFNGGMMSVSSGGTFALTRILGTVPVNEDGSAFMELPAMRSLFFIALDGEGKAVKRMHSFTTLMPGENAACIGCHEDRTMTPTPQDRLQMMRAMQQPPARPKPVEGVPELFDYFRDIVPIWERHCVECHNEDQRGGGISLDSDLRPGEFVESYAVLSWKGFLGDNRNRPMSDFKPYEIGSCASRLMQIVEAGHPDAEGKPRTNVSPEEKRTIRFWLEAGANYAGTYAANASGSLIWYYSPYGQDGREVGSVPTPVNSWPETQAMAEVVRRRCASCHADSENWPFRLPETMVHQGLKFNVNWVFNLSKPEMSRMLRAPLSAEAGGQGRCRVRGEDGNWAGPANVFQTKEDPDYQTMLRGIVRGREYVTGTESTHFSIRPFYPNPWYVREMQRYGVLPEDYVPGTPIDPYETDRKYWELLQKP